MRLLRRRKPAQEKFADADVERLSARADSIVTELDIVVKQMSDMLRKAPRESHD
jgi:hypothetical protein